MFKNIQYSFIKLIGWFIPKNVNTWFCMPYIGCPALSVDLLNYTQDTVYSFIQHIINNHSSEKLKIFLVYFDIQRYDKITEYIKSLNNVKIIPILYGKTLLQRIHFYYCFYLSGIIISSTVYNGFFGKLKKQIHICVSYYAAPSKNDPIVNQGNSHHIDYAIMSSKFACQVDSSATHILQEKYRAFGLPKEDNIIKPRYSKEEIWEKLGLNNNIKKIIIYTPTHKDYEQNSNIGRNVLGYEGDYSNFNERLKIYNTVLLLKIHIKQEQKCIKYIEGLSNIQIFQSTYEYTVCDVMPYTDLMITDYSSIAFDYMLTRKPIIYNFFDKAIYEETRGFCYEPIEFICAGPIVKTKQELEDAIASYLHNKDNPYKEKYELLRSLTHKYDDGNASERIYSFIKQLMKVDI
jgi:hypothetical protein